MAITVDSIFKLIESGKLTPEEKSLTEKFATRTSYDVEGSSLNPMMEDFRLGGIGLSTPSESGYLLFRDYTNPGGEMSAETRQKLRGLMMFISKNKASVFNASYEFSVTLSQFGVRTEFDDVFMMAKALDYKGGLKDQAQVHLGIRGWTKEIDEALEILEVILVQFKPTKDAKQESGFRDKKEFLTLQEKGIREAVDAICGKDLKGTPQIKAAFERWIAVTTELYRSEELAYQYLENWIKYKRQCMDFDVRYTDLPAYRIDENGNKIASMISKYCCLDCHYTDQLRDKYAAEIEAKGLVHAAEVYNRQMQFACALETNGFRWDDARAESLKEQYLIEATESLKQFLLLPRTKQILEINSVQEIEILSATNIEQLKKYFNPDSTAPANTAKLSQILSTDKIKMSMMFSTLLSESQQMDATTERDYPLLMKLIYSFNKDNLPKDYVVMVIKSIIHANQNGTLNEMERAMLGRYANWTLPDATSETIESVANAAKRFLGVDLDKEETWTDDYKLVFYYKKVKKITKAVSAFIDGKNGRKAVKVVKSVKVGAGYYHRVSDYRKLTDEDLDFDAIRGLLSGVSASELLATESTL